MRGLIKEAAARELLEPCRSHQVTYPCGQGRLWSQNKTHGFSNKTHRTPGHQLFRCAWAQFCSLASFSKAF